MEFRWIAVLAVWTLLIGPILGPPVGNRGTSAPLVAKVAPVR